MVLRIAIFTIIALISQVHSQLCVSPGVAPQIVATSGCATPQVVASPVVATTIIDNSVSNALANALQLLIVSELIESKLGPSIPNVLLNGLGSVIEPIASIYPSIIDVSPQVEYRTPYITPIEVISQPTTIIPNYCGGVDSIYSNPYVTTTVVPNYCTSISDLLLPNLISTNNVISLNPYGGVTEYIAVPQSLPTVCGLADIISPTCGINYGGYTELVSPNMYNPYGGVAELISALSPLNTGCGIAEIIGSISPYSTGCYGGIGDIISTIPYNTCGGIEVINPIAPFNPGCGINDLITGNIFTPNYCGGIAEVISPVATGNFRCFSGVPEVISPLSFSSGCLSNVPDIISINPYGSCNSYADVIVPGQYSSFYPGVAEIISPITTSCCCGGVNYPTSNFGPIATEVFFPPTIPAQITCNCGFLPSFF